MSESYGVNTDALFFTSLETPAAIDRVNGELAPAIRDLAEQIASTPNPRLYLTGGGASLAAMMSGSWLFDRFTKVPVSAQTGWQLLSRAPAGIDEQAFVFGTSYSGQTPEVLETLRLAKERGATTVGLTNTAETPLAQLADRALDFRSKAVYTAPLAILYRLAGELLQLTGEGPDQGEAIITGLEALPEKVADLAEATWRDAKAKAAEAADVDAFYVVAGGPNYGLAHKLALSVVIENLWKDAAPVDAGEFYHGPIEIIPQRGAADDKRMFVHLLGDDASRRAGQQAVDFCARMGARQIVFDATEHLGFGSPFTPFGLFVPTEWWVMHMAAQKGHDVDERRYMGKIGARWGEYA